MWQQDMEEAGFMSMVIWADEIVFIKEKGIRMTRIGRIYTDLGFLKTKNV